MQLDKRIFYLIREKYKTEEGNNFYCSLLFKDKNDISLQTNAEGKPAVIETHNIKYNFSHDKSIFCLENPNYAIKNTGLEEENFINIKRDLTGRFKWYYLELGGNRIEFHEGNYLHDTKGCPLFGLGFKKNKIYKSKDLIISESRSTMEFLKESIFLGDVQGQIVGRLCITTPEEIKNYFYKQISR
jgi:hypothetical protein